MCIRPAKSFENEEEAGQPARIFIWQDPGCLSLSPPLFFLSFFFLLTFVDQPLLTCRVVFLRIKTPSFVWTLCYCGKI